MHELNRHRTGEVGLEGTRYHPDGHPAAWVQVLVKVDALPAE